MADLTALLGSAAPTLSESLIRASVQGGVFILLVWTVSKFMPRLPASARCILWWLASLKLLVAFVCIDPLPIPVLEPASNPRLEPASASLFAPLAVPDSRQSQALQTVTDASHSFEWSALAIGVWAAIVGLLLAALGNRIRRITGIARRSAEAPREIRELAACLADTLALRPLPSIKFSEEVDTPLVLGFHKPQVLLPAGPFTALSREQQRMALCHELLHLRRKDLWLGYVPALAERLFFFHPLAHLAVREYQLSREAACDAAVIRTLNALPRDYGRLLLALGITRHPVPVAAAGSPSSYSKLKRRITMLRDVSNQSPRLRIASFAAVLVAAFAITPFTFVARSQDRPPVIARSADPEASPTPVLAQARAQVPVAPAPARVDERERHLNYVLFLGDDHTMMSGSSADVSRARSFRQGNEQMLWFRRAGREYVVRDPALLDQVREIYRPLQEIGGEQAKIGAKQAEIGGRQAEIGKKQAAIGGKQAEIGAHQAQVGAKQAEFEARRAGRQNVQKEELENERRQIELEMQQLEGQMHELSAQMQEFNSPMQDLSKKMNALSEEMNVLSRKMQEASAKAEAEMSGLLDKAISSGKATEVK